MLSDDERMAIFAALKRKSTVPVVPIVPAKTPRKQKPLKSLVPKAQVRFSL
jgi:hypothetical protein